MGGTGTTAADEKSHSTVSCHPELLVVDACIMDGVSLWHKEKSPSLLPKLVTTMATASVHA